MPSSLIAVTATAGLVTLAGLVALPAAAADLAVEVQGVRSDTGHLIVAVQTPQAADEFPYAEELFAGTHQQTHEGVMRFVFRDLPPGRYAVSVFHDENGNGEIDLGAAGIPTEGYGFANNPPSQFGPPSFEEAAVTIGDASAKVVILVAY